MKVVGYCVKGNKRYVAFRKNGDADSIHITDGFHDRKVTYEEQRSLMWVNAEDTDLVRIINRMRGARPWHPLLGELRKEQSK